MAAVTALLAYYPDPVFTAQTDAILGKARVLHAAICCAHRMLL